jgi:hypothetical protein
MLEELEKTPAGLAKHEVIPVVFVPLLGAKGWQEKDE